METKIGNTLFYIKFLDYLVDRIPGLWYDVDEKTDLYSWGYIPQSINEREIEKDGIESIQVVAEEVTEYLKIVK
jgi:hypothetical protein